MRWVRRIDGGILGHLAYVVTDGRYRTASPLAGVSKAQAESLVATGDWEYVNGNGNGSQVATRQNDRATTMAESEPEEPVGTMKQTRVQGGWAEVHKAGPSLWMAIWVADAGTGSPGGWSVRMRAGSMSGDDLLERAVSEWTAKRPCASDDRDASPPHDHPL